LKELTPEWYFSDGNFLMLPDGLDLGVRANGRRVGGVVLPPWAFSAADFVVRCREAIESDHVSLQLHHWVDLIFGFKQRGPAALAADNLFYYLTYDDAFNIESITDTDRLAALQSQIAEFGQTPPQLFSHRLPSRGSGSSLKRAMLPPGTEVDREEIITLHEAASHEGPADNSGSSSSGVFTSLPNLAWRGVSFPVESPRGVDENVASKCLSGAHSDTITRLSAALFDTANAGSFGIHVLSSSRDGTVALFDIVVPPHCLDTDSLGDSSPVLFSPLCRFHPGAAPLLQAPAPSLSSLLLLWSALYGTATVPAKPTPVSAAVCIFTHSVVFSACWDGSIFAHAASDPGLVLWRSTVHNGAVSDLKVIPLTQRLERLPTLPGGYDRGLTSSSDGGAQTEPAAVGEERRYILISGAWDGTIGLSAVSVFQEPSGSIVVCNCAATVSVPGLHSAAITAINYCGRGITGIAEFNVFSADASGQIVWIRVRAHAAALPLKSSNERRHGVFLTCDVLAHCSALVDTTPDAKRRSNSDAISGGISGISCLTAQWADTTSNIFMKSQQASVLITACTVDGRLCLLAGNATSLVSGYIGTERLSLIATVATGEVLRCLVVDRSGLVAITGGHSGRLRFWSHARIFSFCTSNTALPPELSSSDAEIEMPTSLSVNESMGAILSSSVSCSEARKSWITSCALVEECSDEFSDHEDAAPDNPKCRQICILAGMQSGHVMAWVATNPPVTAIA
jgi:hypothetical protein